MMAILKPEMAALLNGILLGRDRGLPRDLSEDFQTTGTSHIVAISGFNMAIIAGILLRGSRYFVKPRAAGVIAIAGMAVYTILVGADPSVVRAAIMGSLLIIALLFLGRPTFIYASLFAAALLMTAINPLILWDAGFQLSFMAVLGLMLYVSRWSKGIHDKLEPRLGEATSRRVTKMTADVILTTMAAILMTLPVILYHFRTFSVVSPLANLLILPAQPGIMILGGLATILGMIALPVGQVVAWTAWLPLAYTIQTVRFFATLPFSAVDVSFPALGVFAYGGVVAAMTWMSGQEKGKKLDVLGRSWPSRLTSLGIAAVVFGAILAGIWIANQPDGRLHVTFFDVGQGDAVFIETPKGRQIVVDGGQYPSLFLDKLGQKIPFWDKEIDVMVASHPDEDHTMGLTETFDHYQVDLLLVNGEEANVSDSYSALLDAAGEGQTVVRRALAGEVVELADGVRLEILHPGEAPDLEERNESSVATRVVYGNFALLLTGDAEEGAEQMMMASGRPLRATVFKAGHHGARSSNSRAFLQEVRPRIMIISAGKENRFDHPHAEVLERAEEIGAAVLRTDEMGSVEIISDGQQIWVETER
jgi:competence protein ComEC